MAAVLVCREAREDSVLGNVALAKALAPRRGGATVVFTGEALWALALGTFEWSPNFKGREMRAAITRAADANGHAIADPTRDPRWTDVRGFVERVSKDDGLRLVACPIWSALLDLGDEANYLERIEEAQLAELLETADVVIGGY